MEPVCFNILPKELEEELLHRYFVSSCIDLTPGPFTLAEVCIQKRVNYFGIAWTDYHAEQGREKLRMAALKCMCTPGHVHFNAKCASVMDADNAGRKKRSKHNEDGDESDEAKIAKKAKPDDDKKGNMDDDKKAKQDKGDKKKEGRDG